MDAIYVIFRMFVAISGLAKLLPVRNTSSVTRRPMQSVVSTVSYLFNGLITICLFRLLRPLFPAILAISRVFLWCG